MIPFSSYPRIFSCISLSRLFVSLFPFFFSTDGYIMARLSCLALFHESIEPVVYATCVLGASCSPMLIRIARDYRVPPDGYGSRPCSLRPCLSLFHFSHVYSLQPYLLTATMFTYSAMLSYHSQTFITAGRLFYCSQISLLQLYLLIAVRLACCSPALQPGLLVAHAWCISHPPSCGEAMGSLTIIHMCFRL